jgi:hypothetical protein
MSIWAHIIQATLLGEQNQLIRHVRVFDDLQVSNLTIIVAAAEGLPPRTDDWLIHVSGAGTSVSHRLHNLIPSTSLKYARRW